MADETELGNSTQRPIVRSSTGVPTWLIAFAAVAAVAIVFILQNRDRTNIDFLVFELHSRTWTAIVTSMVLGVVLDRLFLNWWRRRKAAGR